ncbi:helix-turn-helix domain-containing protein [Herbidospora mongoliensis]|uniref:helix-turn-helix domain-containing protein n=1 Tax=Herbidospora mongoliensis TaxID=688067 RepID=UPI000836170C|nr:helix-turn-helix transcriptional regulator [Herbidospora mongoliensis]
MADNESASPRRRRLGQLLRNLRESTGMTGEQAAARVGWSAAKVSRIETAKTLPSEDDISILADLYKVDEATHQGARKLRHDAVQKGWWEKYGDSLDQGFGVFVGLEAEATTLRNWEPQVIPGLLQIEDYARALMENTMQPIVQIPPTWQRDRLEVRMRRQQMHLFSKDPLQLLAVLDEGTLGRRVAAPDVMSRQLQHLLKISELGHIEIRVISRMTPSPVNSAPFVHFKFDDFPDTVYLEVLEGSRYLSDVQQVYYYERVFDHLMGVALDEGSSRHLINEHLRSWQAAACLDQEKESASQ